MFEQSLRLKEAGAAYEVQFRLPWYRALPMSCVHALHIWSETGMVTDFQLVRDENGEILIPGSEQWWSPFDDSRILFPHRPTKLEEAVLSLRIPYHGRPPQFEQMTFRFSFEGSGQ